MRIILIYQSSLTPSIRYVMKFQNFVRTIVNTFFYSTTPQSKDLTVNVMRNTKSNTDNEYNTSYYI